MADAGLRLTAVHEPLARKARGLKNFRMKSPNTAPFHRIKSLAIIGGFLDGLRIDFADGLNCIIGARGTGKSTILEFVRYAMDALPTKDASPAARRRVETLISNNLEGGRVELRVETKDGLTYIISRADGEDPVVLDAQRKPTAISVKGLFRADIYSQNDVETIADQSRYQLDLIDGFESARLSNLDYSIGDIRNHLISSAHALEPLRRDLVTLDEELKKLPDIEDRLKGLAAGTDGGNETINKAHAAKARRDREARALKNVEQQMSTLRHSIQDMTGSIRSQIAPLLGEELLASENAAFFKELSGSLDACAKAVDAQFALAVRAIEKFEDASFDIGNKLVVAHQEQEMAFRALIEKHRAHQAQSVERSNLEKLRNNLLEKRRQREDFLRQIGTAEAERLKLLDQLSDLRDERFGVREEIAERLNHELMPEIRVTMRQHGDPSEYQSFLEESLLKQHKRPALVAQKLVTALTPTQLAAIIRARDAQALVERADLNPDQATKVLAAFSDEPTLYKLETVELRDDPSIELKDGTEYKDSASLSTGQKCTTILPILMLESENPLLVDQPEDNLDNRFIFKTVVTKIQKVRATRQLIFVTHNPNIPVLGDASRVFVMESDGDHGSKTAEGSVDECKQNIVTLLEGGEDAFRQRGQRYRFDA